MAESDRSDSAGHHQKHDRWAGIILIAFAGAALIAANGLLAEF